jgi:hypothetical protein
MRKIVYMEWVKTRPRARYEIGGSGVMPVHIDELPEAREALEINDFNLYGYRPLIHALADRYEVSADQVITAPGTSMANYLAIAAIVLATKCWWNTQRTNRCSIFRGCSERRSVDLSGGFILTLLASPINSRPVQS